MTALRTAAARRAGIGLPTLAAYALPWLPLAFILMPLGMFMPAYYASHTAATLAGAGLAIGLARALSAFADPWIGYLSDRTRSAIGPRKPWILAGAALTVLSVWQLFQPPPGAGLLYCLLWAVALYVSMACVEIPLRAWGSEMSPDPAQRVRLFTTVGWAAAVGNLAFWLLPVLTQGSVGSAGLNDPHAMAWVVSAFAIALPLVVLLATAGIPHARPAPMPIDPFRQMLRSVAGNRPFRLYVASMTLWGLGSGAGVSVLFIYMSDTLKLGAQAGPLMVTFFVVQLLAMPLWVRLLARYTKHRLLAVCWLLDAAIKPALFFIDPAAPDIAWLYGLFIVSGVLGSISYSFPNAVLAEVVDYDFLQSRARRTASYYALNTFMFKVTMGLGTGLGLFILGASGYAVGQPHGAAALWGMWIGIAVLPAACLVAASGLMWNFPLNPRRHAAIARRLAARQRRASAPGPRDPGRG